MLLLPAEIKKHADAVLHKPDAPLVVWNAVPPVGTSWRLHKRALLEAFYAALSFIKTEGVEEWVVIGQPLTPIVRTLFRFKEVGIRNDALTFLGTVINLRIYLDRDQTEAVFFAGNGDKVCRGQVVGLPH